MKRIVFYMLGLCLPLGMVSGCAQQDVSFTAPQERPVARKEAPWPANRVMVIAYHDIADSDPDQQYVGARTANFIAQLRWLKAHGYQAVSVDQILAARDGKAKLPDRAILLTFDDGYRSFYERVYPILKRFHWPAVFAPVGAWIDTPADKMVNFGGQMRPRDKFVTWDMIREMSDSGLIEIGSHTYDMHYGIPANPQGNIEPAAATRLYDPKTKHYETDDEFHARTEHDVVRITDRIKDVTGKAPRVWIWPYGAESGITRDIAKAHGYELAMTLEDGLLDPGNLMNVPRALIAGDPDINVFANQIVNIQEQNAQRVMRIDLDYIYDPNPVQMDANVGKLIDRLAEMRPTTVILQAYADPEGNGQVKSVYFPSRELPMRADLFNRVVNQIHTRIANDVKVYAWMPVLSFDLKGLPRVASWQANGHPVIKHAPYERLTPFDPAVREHIRQVYRDMANSIPVLDGLAFHDDLVMSDYEDVSAPALAEMQRAGFGTDIAAIRRDPVRLREWARFKGRFMNDFTKVLISDVRAIRGDSVKTARNIFVRPLVDPNAEDWYAENIDDYLATYDYVMPMLMPYMEKIRNPAEIKRWMQAAVDQVKRRPEGMDKTIFELQTVDWDRQDRDIPTTVLVGWMKDLYAMGAKSVGYYPDDFYRNKPELEVIRPAFTSYWFPDRKN